MSLSEIPDDAPLNPDDELLVSYLDGELSREEEADLQNRLVDSDSLRNRLRTLQTGWDLLDDLPDATPSLRLVESTLELAVVDLEKTNTSKSWNLTSLRWPSLILLTTLLGIATAFGVSRSLKRQAYKKQLNDLAIAENLDAYLRGQDIELMRILSASTNWAAMISAATEVEDLAKNDANPISNVSLEERESFIRELPIEKLRQLDLRWDRFNALSSENQNVVRQTAESVKSQPDSELLLKTMRTYAIWSQSLSSELRDGIESDDAILRQTSIEKAIETSQIAISQRSRLKLDDEITELIYFALKQIIRDRVTRNDQKTISHLDRMRERFPTGQDPYFGTIASMVFSGSQRNNQGGESSSLRRSFLLGGGGTERPSPITNREAATIRFVIPDATLEILDLIAGGDPILENITLRAWSEEAVRRHFPMRHNAESTYLERYTELPSTERDIVDLMPPKEILSELSRESPFP